MTAKAKLILVTPADVAVNLNDTAIWDVYGTSGVDKFDINAGAQATINGQNGEDVYYFLGSAADYQVKMAGSIAVFKHMATGNEVSFAMSESGDLVQFNGSTQALLKIDATGAFLGTQQLTDTDAPVVGANLLPVVTTDTFSIATSAGDGAWVGTVMATDSDGSIANMAITAGNDDVDGNGTKAFAIDTNGNLTVLDRGDLQVGHPFTLTVQATDDRGATGTADVRINVTAPPTPTYSLTADKAQVNEGETATFSVATTNVSAGTSLAYTLTGIQAADLSGTDPNTDGDNNPLTGVVTVDAAGKATISVALAADQITEGDETLVVALKDDSAATASTLVKDTSLNPATALPVGKGATQTVAATDGADIFSLALEGVSGTGAYATSDNTQITLNGFSAAADSLVFDLPGTAAAGFSTLNQLSGVSIDATHTVAVQVNQIAGSTLINFGPDGNGDLVTLTLAGIADPATVHITVV